MYGQKVTHHSLHVNARKRENIVLFKNGSPEYLEGVLTIYMTRYELDMTVGLFSSQVPVHCKFDGTIRLPQTLYIPPNFLKPNMLNNFCEYEITEGGRGYLFIRLKQ